MENINPNVLFISTNDMMPISFDGDFKEYGFNVLKIKNLVDFNSTFQEEVEKYNFKSIIINTSYFPNKTLDQLVAIRNVFKRQIPIIGLFSKTDFVEYEEISRLPVDDILFNPVEIDVLVRRIQFRINQIQSIIDHYDQKIDRYLKGLKLISNHEFNTPMTAIIGFSELLKLSIGDLKKEEIREYVYYIHGGATRLMGLMRRIRLWQDLERRVFISQNNIVLINETFIYDIIKKYAKKYNRENDILYDSNGFALNEDSAAIELIVSELLDNAFKFSKPETKVLISVFHNGIIIKSISNISFSTKDISEFYQYDRAKYEQQGVGLGIAIVKLCCSAIGARLSMGLADNYFNIKVIFND